jgi:hypothetical protein
MKLRILREVSEEAIEPKNTTSSGRLTVTELIKFLRSLKNARITSLSVSHDVDYPSMATIGIEIKTTNEDVWNWRKFFRGIL